MRTTLIIAPAVAALALLGGCQNSSEKQTTNKTDKPKTVMAGDLEGKSPMDIWPTKVGTQTTYDAVINGKVASITFKVVGAKPGGKNGQDVSFEVYNGASTTPTDTPVWRIDETGVSQLSARKNIPFTPPEYLAYFPIKFGEEHNYKGTGAFPLGKGGPGPITGKTRIRGQEVVQTDMGDIEALAIEAIYVWKADNLSFRSEETAWVAPHYGLVRYKQTILFQNAKKETGSQSQTLVLKSYSSP